MADRKNRKNLTEKEIALVVQEAETTVRGLESVPNKIRKLNMEKDQNYEILLEQGRITREIQRQVRAKQKWALEPFDEAKKRTKSLFVPMLNTCEEVLELVEEKRMEHGQIQDRKMLEEQEKLDREAEEEQKRLDRNAKAKATRLLKKEDHSRAAQLSAKEIVNSVGKVEPAKAEEPVAPKVDGVSVAKIWDFEILDEREVPEFFEDPAGDCIKLWDRKFDREALLTLCRTMVTEDANPFIPGVRFFQKDSPRYGRL